MPHAIARSIAAATFALLSALPAAAQFGFREGQAWRYEPAHWSDQGLTPGDDDRRWQEESGHGHGNHQDRDQFREHDER